MVVIKVIDLFKKIITKSGSQDAEEKTNPLRKVERKENGHWINIEFIDIKKGDTFRLFEPTGEPVIGKNANNDLMIEFTATSDAFYDKETNEPTVKIFDNKGEINMCEKCEAAKTVIYDNMKILRNKLADIDKKLNNPALMNLEKTPLLDEKESIEQNLMVLESVLEKLH